MIFGVSTPESRARNKRKAQRSLLKVEGMVYTVRGLAEVLGFPVGEVQREVTAALRGRHAPLTLEGLRRTLEANHE